MAYEVPGEIIGNLNATADLSALQFCAVSLTTLGGVAAPTTANTAKVLGILQNTPTSNQTCEIMVSGISKLVAGSTAFVAGDLCMATSVGRGTPWTSGTTAFIFAEVLESALTTGHMTVAVFRAQRVV